MKKLTAQELNRPSLEKYRVLEKLPLHVVLDNVRSALNVGSIFRSADAFGVLKIHLCGITAQPPHREILKTSLGAESSVEWSHHENTVEALKQLKSENVTLYGIEQTNKSQLLADYSWSSSQAVAMVFGNEVDGISSEALGLLDHAIELEQVGTKHSINVAVCAGVVLWQLRQCFTNQ